MHISGLKVAINELASQRSITRLVPLIKSIHSSRFNTATMATSYVSQQPSGYSNYIKNIAIVGATGTIGTHIVSALLTKKQFNITAISRAGSQSTFPKDVKVANIDYNDPSTIVTALKGHDALIITLSVMAARDTQAKLIHAAADAGVPWVFPNEFGMYNTEEAQNETIGNSKT
jgi:uncharacterized protein (UPF0333 family)